MQCGGVSDLEYPRWPKTRECLMATGQTMPRTVAATGGPTCWCNSTDCSGFPTLGGDSTAAIAMTAGCDLDCGGLYKANMQQALQSGAVLEEQLDAALVRLFLSRFKTGEFDPPEQNPYRQIPPSAANSAEHQALALSAAAEGLTLLKNARGTLPLSQQAIQTLAVIGPNANCTQQVRPHGPHGDHHCNQLGNYATESPFVITPADGLAKFATVTGVAAFDSIAQRMKPVDCQKPSSTINNRLAVLFRQVARGATSRLTTAAFQPLQTSASLPWHRRWQQMLTRQFWSLVCWYCARLRIRSLAPAAVKAKGTIVTGAHWVLLSRRALYGLPCWCLLLVVAIRLTMAGLQC